MDPFLFACFNHHHHHREAPSTFQVICCLTWKPLAQLTLFQHVLLHTEPPVANPRFLSRKRKESPDSLTHFGNVQKIYSKLYCGYEQVVSQLPLPQGTAEQCQQSRTDTEAEISLVPCYYLSFSTVKQYEPSRKLFYIY